jgi:hypothetical protein
LLWKEAMDDEKIKLVAFHSTPSFVKALTDIAKKLSKLNLPKEKKHEELKEELRIINRKLPAACYIPFVNGSIRNYCVLHVPPNETRIF